MRKILLFMFMVCFPTLTMLGQSLEYKHKMVFVQGGTFNMGCTNEQGSDCFDWEKFSETVPNRGVTVKDYYIGQYEVTQKQWKDIMGSNPSVNQGDDLPVQNVSWDEIQVFIERLNARTGMKYRLPNEIEWEYAARGGNKSAGYKYSGSDIAAEVGWYNSNSDGKTHEVGSIGKANELGIYDMSGNVGEWCNSRYLPYDYTGGGLTYELITLDYDWMCGCYHNILIPINSVGYKENFRVIRGGAYKQQETQLRVSFRNSFAKENSSDNLGFRLACDEFPDYCIVLSDTLDNPMKGVAADGVAKLRIKVIPNVENAPELFSIMFKKEGSTAIIDETIEGKIRKANGEPLTTIEKPQLVEGKSYYEFLYIAPEDHGLSSYQYEKTLYLTAELYFGTEVADVSFTIEIVRPPVLMVHGLNSSPSESFLSLYSRLISSGYNFYQLGFANYSSSNTVSFSANSWVIPENIRRILTIMSNKGYAARKIDIVGHSMGGLLTRQYQQSLQYKGDINRIITINTPHSGSQAANLLANIDNTNVIDVLGHINYLASYIPAWSDKAQYINSYYEEYVRFVQQGAVNDLRVDSEAIRKLNENNQLTVNIVPSHAIYTIHDLPFNPLTFDKIDLFYAFMSVGLNFYDLSISDLYNGEENDLIVAESSQKGGLTGSNISYFENWHSSTNNPSVINQVIQLLNESAYNEDYFSIQGYNPPQLSPPQLSPSRTNAKMRSTEDCEVSIVSINKPQCTNGDEIKTSVVGCNNIIKMSFLAQGENIGLFHMETKEGNNNEFTYTIPESAFGVRKILVIGYTDDGNVVLTTSQVEVTTDATLIYIEPLQKELLLPLSTTQTVEVQGLYSDGIVRNITSLVSCSIKGENIEMELPNVVIGKQIGLDTVIIRYLEFETMLPVEVLDITPYNIDKGVPTNIKDVQDKDEIKHKVLICYPNPANDNVTIRYELEKKANSLIHIYSSQGTLIKTIKTGERNAGVHEETIVISTYPTGIYFVILESNNIKYGSSLIKK